MKLSELIIKFREMEKLEDKLKNYENSLERKRKHNSTELSSDQHKYSDLDLQLDEAAIKVIKENIEKIDVDFKIFGPIKSFLEDGV